MNLARLQQLDPAAPSANLQSRRAFVGGLGAAMAGPMLAESAAEAPARPASGEAPGQTVKKNPAEQYFKGPYKKQLQP